MPNHVTNIIRLNGDQARIDALLNLVKYDDGERGTLDFNKIIPMPNELNLTSGSEETHAINACLSAINPANKAFPYVKKMSANNFNGLLRQLNGSRMFGKFEATLTPSDVQEKYLKRPDKTVAEYVELGAKYVSNFMKYGATTWYDFAVREWGTKWNSYDSSPFKDNSLTFNTAWSAPHPIVAKLAEMYPDIEFTHEWADEDLGQNCGRYEYKDGERCEEYFPESQKDCIEFAARILESEPADYGLFLNATESEYIMLPDADFERIEVAGVNALFTSARMTDAEIPQGLHSYQLRESDDGDRFCTLEKKVCVNFGGTVIVKEPLDLGKEGYIALSDDTEPNFLGESCTIEEFMSDSPIESMDMNM